MKKKDSKEDNNQTSQGKRSGKQFVCRYCGRTVSAAAPGTHHRNHCPWCLRSIHLDKQAGDRASSCDSIMEPIAISIRQGNEWVLIHRCNKCGVLKENRIAGDDNEWALLSLAVRPVAQPPFPLDGLYSQKEE
jgi:hypothetical protein